MPMEVDKSDRVIEYIILPFLIFMFINFLSTYVIFCLESARF